MNERLLLTLPPRVESFGPKKVGLATPLLPDLCLEFGLATTGANNPNITTVVATMLAAVVALAVPTESGLT